MRLGASGSMGGKGEKQGAILFCLFGFCGLVAREPEGR
jgi:hypothetical protein